jgi:hypothetical protein
MQPSEGFALGHPLARVAGRRNSSRGFTSWQAKDNNRIGSSSWAAAWQVWRSSPRSGGGGVGRVARVKKCRRSRSSTAIPLMCGNRRCTLSRRGRSKTIARKYLSPPARRSDKMQKTQPQYLRHGVSPIHRGFSLKHKKTHVLALHVGFLINIGQLPHWGLQ